VPLIHDVVQLHTIFIFCKNKTGHEQWAKEWFKIKGIFTEISPICEALKEVAQQCEQNAIPISLISTSDDVSKKNLDQLDPSFLYTQIMKEILLKIKFEPKHFAEYIDHCCDVFAENKSELKKVKEFKREYHDKTPVRWYSYADFLYKMLNLSLRTIDVNIIIKMGFFISDLHCHIERLHKEQFNGQNSGSSFTLYRGQGMSKIDFEQMIKNKGGLISFNSFLSTSMDRDVSHSFAESSAGNPALIGILFVLTIDSSKYSAPFASINSVSHFQDEDEVLFSMLTVFRICNITPMDENQRLFQVELTLTDDNDKDLRVLTDRIREETFPDNEGWYRLGLVLLKMGQFDKAEEVYEILLSQRTEENKKAPIYHQLGVIKYDQGEYKQAAIFYEKTIEIERKAIPLNHHSLANSTVNLANVYSSMGDYRKALSLHEEALKIYQKILPPNHPYLASSHSNIGEVYRNMGEYSKALLSHEKALEIRQQSLPPNHPDLAQSYNNIGLVYSNMGEYLKALLSHEKALKIQQRSLLPNHPNLASSHSNIGEVYRNMGEYSKACSSHEKALEIQQQLLPPNHPHLAMSYNNIGNAYISMGEYSKARSFYEKGLEIQQQLFPPNHPDLAAPYNNIGNACFSMGEYSKARSFYEKGLKVQQQSLPPNHPHLAMSYNNTGNAYFSMGEYSKARSFYEKGLQIQQQSLPPNHPDLTGSYNNIGNVYYSMGEYSKARSFYERAVDIAQQSLPANHPNLRMCRDNLDIVKRNCN
jgi:tetratricopeptide (TPR) repeat protein